MLALRLWLRWCRFRTKETTLGAQLLPGLVPVLVQHLGEIEARTTPPHAAVGPTACAREHTREREREHGTSMRVGMSAGARVNITWHRHSTGGRGAPWCQPASVLLGARTSRGTHKRRRSTLRSEGDGGLLSLHGLGLVRAAKRHGARGGWPLGRRTACGTALQHATPAPTQLASWGFAAPALAGVHPRRWG